MRPPKKPTLAAANSKAASSHWPSPAQNSPRVGNTPIRVNSSSRRFLAPCLSATAPSQGDISITSKLAAELNSPSQKVLWAAAISPAQYCLNSTGKKPASTVVAKVELAQSYSAQDQAARFLRVRRVMEWGASKRE